MCQVHTGAYVSLLAPGKTDYTACHPRETATTYVLHVVSITTNTDDRRKSIGKKEAKEIKEDKGKKRKEKKAKNKKYEETKEKTRLEEEARKGKGKHPLYFFNTYFYFAVSGQVSLLQSSGLSPLRIYSFRAHIEMPRPPPFLSSPSPDPSS